ncbi:hypothetical protein M885DRAFT_520602 [Pelagophyceae sp. CCMP2097]|nr:hypothetical protein M885DRAFT_520602 [Pelagophyceae sp. CCMP2097]
MLGSARAPATAARKAPPRIPLKAPAPSRRPAPHVSPPSAPASPPRSPTQPARARSQQRSPSYSPTSDSSSLSPSPRRDLRQPSSSPVRGGREESSTSPSPSPASCGGARKRPRPAEARCAPALPEAPPASAAGALASEVAARVLLLARTADAADDAALRSSISFEPLDGVAISLRSSTASARRCYAVDCGGLRAHFDHVDDAVDAFLANCELYFADADRNGKLPALKGLRFRGHDAELPLRARQGSDCVVVGWIRVKRGNNADHAADRALDLRAIKQWVKHPPQIERCPP